MQNNLLSPLPLTSISSPSPCIDNSKNQLLSSFATSFNSLPLPLTSRSPSSDCLLPFTSFKIVNNCFHDLVGCDKSEDTPGLPTWKGWQWQWPLWKVTEEEKRWIREELELRQKQLQELCLAVNVESIADLEVVLCRMVLVECVYKVRRLLALAKGIPALELYNLAEKKNQKLVHWEHSLGGAVSL
ncbi:hypothetical protein FCM35_KLT20526 [Carex littledalei]|uniref:Uncharacterized protein n=1 Tax=Carex littledalei TaxID=544730 RepID=A0A833RJJ1_9POAL|nr:hypothetical protein FCM35_KLT20526 [Carex littledalei]